MQGLAVQVRGTTGTTDGLGEALGRYYDRFENCHPLGFRGSLEHFARYLASREQFRGTPARVILDRLRMDRVLTEVSLDKQRTNASTSRCVVKETSA